MVCSARERFLRRLILAVAMAIFAIGVSHVTQHIHLERVVETERSIAHGDPIFINGGIFYPVYNRMLFPVIFDGITRALPSVRDKDIYVALRFVVFALSFFLIFSSIEARAKAAAANATAICLATGLCFTMTLIRHPWPMTSDIFDLLIMFYVFLHLMEKRIGLAFLLACLTAVNRESGAFAGVLYFFLRAGTERPVRLVATSAVLAVVPYVLAVAVRRANFGGALPAGGSGQSLMGLPLNLTAMMEDMLRFNPANDLGLLVGMFAVAGVMLWDRTTMPDGMKRRIALACAAIFCVTLQFGIVREIRVFLPCIALLVAATVARLAPPSPSAASAGVAR